jgi:hypothetical protein
MIEFQATSDAYPYNRADKSLRSYILPNYAMYSQILGMIDALCFEIDVQSLAMQTLSIVVFLAATDETGYNFVVIHSIQAIRWH